MIKQLILTGFSLACLGCSVGPDYHRPDIYSDEAVAQNLKLRVNNPRQISRQWYLDFEDEDLNTLIERGLSNSPSVAAALSKMHQARYRLLIDQSGFLPSFDAQGSYTKSSPSSSVSPLGKTEYFQTGLDASWELDIWGGRRRLSESAQALLRAAADNLDNVKLSLTAEIASTYFKWRLAEKQRLITERNLVLQEDIFQTVQDKYKSGLADDLAYEQAKSVLQTTRMTLPQIKTQEKAYQNALAVLVGDLPDTIVHSKENPLNKKPEVTLSALYNLPADIVRSRPDVRAAEQQLIAQNALIGQAVANLFPSVSLSAFLGYQNKTLSPIFGPDYNMYSSGGNIVMPLLHWGALVNQVKLQESAKQEALALYQASLLQAAADISNSIKALEEETARNADAAENMRSTSQILDLSLAKYKNGLIDFSDISTAEQNKLSAETAYLESKAAVYQNVIGFYKAVGGGYARSSD